MSSNTRNEATPLIGGNQPPQISSQHTPSGYTAWTKYYSPRHRYSTDKVENRETFLNSRHALITRTYEHVVHFRYTGPHDLADRKLETVTYNLNNQSSDLINAAGKRTGFYPYERPHSGPCCCPKVNPYSTEELESQWCECITLSPILGLVVCSIAVCIYSNERYSSQLEANQAIYEQTLLPMAVAHDVKRIDDVVDERLAHRNTQMH